MEFNLAGHVMLTVKFAQVLVNALSVQILLYSLSLVIVTMLVDLTVFNVKKQSVDFVLKELYGMESDVMLTVLQVLSLLMAFVFVAMDFSSKTNALASVQVVIPK